MRIPPGVNEADYLKAVQQWENAIGAEWVFTDEDDVDLYRDGYTPFWGEDEEKIPSAAIAPQTVEEVQALVRTANEFKIPIYTVSTGRNLAYGGSAPVLSGSVVLDLKRLNKIIEVNEENAYALVEPGVSYFDLYRHIQERGLKLWIDCPDPGWGSPIGNALDHGAGYTVTPYRDHFDAHCGMEVVLANGEIMRTGMGALPNSETWQQFKYGYGPTVDGLFAQSNMGIVTKMGFWLYPEPEAYRSGTVLVPRHDDIMPLVEITGRLMNSGIMNAGTALNSPMQFASFRYPELEEMLGKTDTEGIKALDEFALSHDISYWSSRLQFYGPPEIIDASWAYAKRQFESIPGVKFRDDEYVHFPLNEAEIAESNDENFFGIPSLSVFSLGARSAFNPEPSNGHMGFSPVIPMTGEAVIESQRVLAKAFKDLGLDTVFNIFPQSYHPRTLVCLVGFPISKDPDSNRRNREMYRELIKISAAHGWGEYRTHTAFMDDCVATYSYNNNALLRFQESIKDAVDPNGILSAGRYGIWPKHLREERG